MKSRYCKFAAAAVVSLGLLLPSAALAQGLGNAFSGFGGSNDKPIQIESDNLEVLDKQSVAIFTGNVKAQQGPTVMQAGSMKVFYTGSAAGQGGIKRIEIGGKVYVKSGENVATGNTAVVNMESETITLPGDVVLTQPNGNIAKGDVLTVNMKTNQAKLGGKKRVQMLLQPKARN